MIEAEKKAHITHFPRNSTQLILAVGLKIGVVIPKHARSNFHALSTSGVSGVTTHTTQSPKLAALCLTWGKKVAIVSNIGKWAKVPRNRG